MDILSSPRDDFEIQNFSFRQQILIEKKLFTPFSLSYNPLTSILGAGRGGAERTKVYPSTENGGEDDIEGGQVVVF